MDEEQRQSGQATFHHAHIFCLDLDRMIEFWVRTFGVTFVRKRKFGPCDGADMEFRPGVYLYLKQVEPESPEGKRIRMGVDHVGMIVPNLEAFLESIRGLPDVVFDGEPFQSMELYCAFIRGPEDLMVEIAEYRPQACTEKAW